MSNPLPTLGGTVTIDEAYRKLMDHLDNIIDLAHTIGHIHKANDSDLLAKGWHGMAEMMGMVKIQIRQLAMRRMN